MEKAKLEAAVEEAKKQKQKADGWVSDLTKYHLTKLECTRVHDAKSHAINQLNKANDALAELQVQGFVLVNSGDGYN